MCDKRLLQYFLYRYAAQVDIRYISWSSDFGTAKTIAMRSKLKCIDESDKSPDYSN